MLAEKLNPSCELNPVDPCREETIVAFTREGLRSRTFKILREEPLSIRVQGEPYAVVMRTPGDEIAHVVGFCLGEGIIDTYADIKQIACCDSADTNVVTVVLSPARLLKAKSVLERRGFISQSSCGICGKEVVQDLIQSVRPQQDDLRMTWGDLRTCMDLLSQCQSLYPATHASHAAVAFNAELQPLAVGEDVGRHNAVDKAVGKLILGGALADTACLVMSSRISYELVQKVGRARIPIVVAISRPTSLAVDLARKLNITLVCIPDDHTLLVYSAPHRIRHA
jgi:FdhD protein